MAKKKKGEDEVPTPDAPKAEGGGGRKVLLASIVVGVALLGAGAMAGGLVGGGDQTASAAEPTPTATPDDLGVLVELEPLTINLADGRFLKIGAAVELGPEIAEAPATAPIYDAMIAEFNSHTVDELSDPSIRAATKTDLLTSLAGTYGEQIVGVYYTEFVMQ